MKYLRLLLSAVAVIGTSSVAIGQQTQVVKTPVDYVNPNIGSISQELTCTNSFIQLPNSMLRVHPNRGDYTSLTLSGLPMMQVSHYDSNVLTISPVCSEDRAMSPIANYHFDDEHCAPYHYSVYLEEDDIAVNFAPSTKSAIYTFSYSGKKPRFVVLSANDGEVDLTDNAVSGFRNYNGIKVYFYGVFNRPSAGSGQLADGAIHYGTATALNPNPTLVIKFGAQTSSLAFRYGISYISVNQAKKNMIGEIPDFNLDEVATRGRAIWNKALGEIAVTGGTEDQKTVFYTALYRTNERMIDISEDGFYYSGFDHKIHADGGTPFYADDASWDSYRAFHSLAAILDPKREAAEDESYIRDSQQSSNGWMPTTPGVSGEYHFMNGNHFAVILWDDYAKGLRGFDLPAGYAALKKTLNEATLLPWQNEPAGPLDAFYKLHGYLPALHPGEKETEPGVNGFERRQAIPVTLGASYDSWCMAQIAKTLGYADDYKSDTRQAYNYRNLFNPATGFFHAKDADGNFIEPMDYGYSGGYGDRDYYDENNGYTYQWDLLYNEADLVQLMGGRDKYISNLDNLFQNGTGRQKMDYFEQLPDSTGLIGKFSIGNEPGMHIPYLYNYVGQPWKTQSMVRKVLSSWWRNDLQGVPGDEDGGGLSSFAVFSSIGIYPVSPGIPVYNIGSPLFDRTAISLGNGKKFVIVTVNNSDDNKYIQSATLNGESWNKPWIAHSQLVTGGKLVLILGPRPNKFWGASLNDAPPSAGPPQFE